MNPHTRLHDAFFCLVYLLFQFPFKVMELELRCVTVFLYHGGAKGRVGDAAYWVLLRLLIPIALG